MGLTLVEGDFTGANQIRWNAALARLQINADAGLTVDHLIDVTGAGFAFDATTVLILI